MRAECAGVLLRASVLLWLSGLRVRLEMNSLISSPCDSSAEELNAGDHQPGLGAFDGFFEVLGEASVAAEPSEGDG